MPVTGSQNKQMILNKVEHKHGRHTNLSKGEIPALYAL